MRRELGCKGDVLDLLIISHASNCSSVVRETAYSLSVLNRCHYEVLCIARRKPREGSKQYIIK